MLGAGIEGMLDGTGDGTGNGAGTLGCGGCAGAAGSTGAAGCVGCAGAVCGISACGCVSGTGIGIAGTAGCEARTSKFCFICVRSRAKRSRTVIVTTYVPPCAVSGNFMLFVSSTGPPDGTT